jgi:hypothetical protein
MPGEAALQQQPASEPRLLHSSAGRRSSLEPVVAAGLVKRQPASLPRMVYSDMRQVSLDRLSPGPMKQQPASLPRVIHGETRQIALETTSEPAKQTLEAFKQQQQQQLEQQKTSEPAKQQQQQQQQHEQRTASVARSVDSETMRISMGGQLSARMVEAPVSQTMLQHADDFSASMRTLGTAAESQASYVSQVPQIPAELQAAHVSQVPQVSAELQAAHVSQVPQVAQMPTELQASHVTQMSAEDIRSIPQTHYV